MSSDLKKIQPGITALSIYQIVGGLTGIGLVLWLLKPGAFSFSSLLISLLVSVLYAYSVYSGVLLITKIKRGILHSKINQLLQVLSFFMFGYAYKFISGVYATVGLDLTESFSLKFNFGLPAFQINIKSGSPLLLVDLNLVALFLIIFIDNLQKKINRIEAEKQVSAIGQEEELRRF